MENPYIDNSFSKDLNMIYEHQNINENEDIFNNKISKNNKNEIINLLHKKKPKIKI